MEKLYYTVSEVAQMLGEQASCIRYWSDSFPQLSRLKRSSRGNRLYTQKDIELLKEIQRLLQVKGLTINGAVRVLSEGLSSQDNKAKALAGLKLVKARLEEVKKIL